jgi:hypothetical protein
MAILHGMANTWRKPAYKWARNEKIVRPTGGPHEKSFSELNNPDFGFLLRINSNNG